MVQCVYSLFIFVYLCISVLLIIYRSLLLSEMVKHALQRNIHSTDVYLLCPCRPETQTGLMYCSLELLVLASPNENHPAYGAGFFQPTRLLPNRQCQSTGGNMLLKLMCVKFCVSCFPSTAKCCESSRSTRTVSLAA